MPAIFTYALLAVPLIGAYAIFALGISVIYRASRVLNLAHGAMAMVAAFVADSLVRAGIPMGVSLPIAVLFGAALGVGVEWVFVRRLRPQGPTAQTVGTVAVTGLLIALAAKVWGTTPKIAASVFPDGQLNIGESGIRYGAIGLFLTAAVVSAALFWFFKGTEFGLAMRGAAQNRRAAALMGIDPDLAASAAWALGGGLAALAGVMLAAVTTLDPYTLSLQALPAFVAALIGGLESLPGAIGGSVISGLAFGLVPYFSGTPIIGRIARFNGAPQLALTLLTLIVMGVRGRRLSGTEAATLGLVSTARPRASRRRVSLPAVVIVLAILFLLPWITPFSVLQNSLVAMQLAVVAISIVVLTGWVGQISLAQASFVGIAALTMGLVVRGMNLGFPASLILAAAAAAVGAVIVGIVALRVRGLYLAVATLVFAWMCDAFLFKTSWMGAGSGSSVIPPQTFGPKGGWPFVDLASERTLYYVFLAVVAIVLFALANLRDTKTGRAFSAVRGSEMAAASLGIDVVRYKLVAFALAGTLAGISGSMLMLGQRAVVPDQFIFTISLQYLAIAVVGGLGSLSGAIAAGVVFAGLNELFFRVAALSGYLEVVSAGLLALVLLAYPGGLIALVERFRTPAQSLAAKVTRITEPISRFRHVRTKARKPAPQMPEPEQPEAVPEAVGAIVPLDEPAEAPAAVEEPVEEKDDFPPYSGFQADIQRVAKAARWIARAPGRVARLVPKRKPKPAKKAEEQFAAPFIAEPALADGNGHGAAAHSDGKDDLWLEGFNGSGISHLDLPADRNERAPILEASSITVRFGGLTAVSDASIAVREGEIVGLIGPNGAGKTTLFNAILGLNDPASGKIHLYGTDATALPPHERAKLGVARSFQVIQLFGELTVFDNLLVATHLHNSSGLLSNLAASARTLAAERDARARVRRVLTLLELEDVADLSVQGLPFGVLRMVELGRALVTGARFVMLDEPASGLNNAETDRLTDVVRGIRSLGVSVLLIEHDVRMVTGVSDYVYVLDQGRLIAEGRPAEVQRDQRVIHAYLGAAEEETEKVGV